MNAICIIAKTEPVLLLLLLLFHLFLFPAQVGGSAKSIAITCIKLAAANTSSTASQWAATRWKKQEEVEGGRR